MKKTLSLLLILSLLSGAAAALAEDSGYRFSADELGFKIVLEKYWMDAVQSGRLSFWIRKDAGVAKDGVLGYGAVFITPDISGFSEEVKSYEDGEAWLKKNGRLLGGVLSYEAGVEAVSPYADVRETELPAAGGTNYTLFVNENADTDFKDEYLAAVARQVLDSFKEPEKAVERFDAGVDFGELGAFETEAIDGTVINNEYFAEAEYTVLVFWATYCSACIGEMPTIAKIAEEYRDRGVRFLGLATDAYDESSIKLARKIAEEQGLNYPSIPSVIDAEILGEIQYIPSHILLDSNGRRAGELMVGAMSEGEWRSLLDSALNQG